MAAFTKYSSSEFSIRPYIKKDAARAMAYLLALASDDDDKVRRFASEGCRPRLPWAMALPVFKKNHPLQGFLPFDELHNGLFSLCQLQFQPLQLPKGRDLFSGFQPCLYLCGRCCRWPGRHAGNEEGED